jgi:hypothetical protein
MPKAQVSGYVRAEGGHRMNKQRLIIPIVLMFVVLLFVTLPGPAPDQTLPKVYHLGLLGCGPPPSDTGDIVAGLIRGLAAMGSIAIWRSSAAGRSFTSTACRSSSTNWWRAGSM